jgi:hypothetical protein
VPVAQRAVLTAFLAACLRSCFASSMARLASTDHSPPEPATTLPVIGLEQPGLVTGCLADDLALNHDDKLVAKTQHSVQALLADPLRNLRRGQVKALVR